MVDRQTRRRVLRLFSYGLYVVTVSDAGLDNGFTANWVTQCSFDPPLVVVAIENDSRSIELVRSSGVFAINILAAEHRELAGQLGRSYRRAPDKLQGIALHRGATGLPLLDEALGTVECRVVQTCPSGDHTLVVGEIVAVALQRDGKPLTLQEAGYRYSG